MNQKNMKKILLLALLIPVFGMADAQDLVIAKQGHFSVGGQTIQRPGSMTTVSLSVGLPKSRPGRAIVRIMLSWISKFRPMRKNCLWFMFMVMVALGYVGK